MRFSTLPPLILAIGLLFGAALDYPGGASIALGAVGCVVIGMWLTLEVGTEVAERWRRVRGDKDAADTDRETEND